MIFGIGTDIVEVRRMEKWAADSKMLERFFNPNEIKQNGTAEYYAARYAAKEAFAKALGTGFKSFELSEIFVTKDELGKPELNCTGKALKLLNERCGECQLFLSLSHEKDYAIAYVVIEKL